ncbi:MAG: penicillin-binding protein, partial [Thermodesulfobacteriota bacterium]
VDSVYANPGSVESTRETAEELSSILEFSDIEIEKKLKAKRRFVWVKRKVELSEGERATVKGLKGINTIKESRRYYPNRELAANLLGFEGIDSKGLEGIELRYDDYMQGSTVKIAGERDARGRLILYEDIEKRSAAHGMDVVLTIDKTLQNIAEQALTKAVESSGAKGGMAVVMDPYSGELLALANSPTYDPNRFHRYGPSSWRNRAITDSFEPGSVFKIFLLASVIEEGLSEPNDIFFCENGSYKVADRVFHDTKKHGWLTLANIIKYSSNIGAAKVGRKLGKERFYLYLKRFGFGARTGIDFPGEARGTLRNYKNWSRVTLETVSFGQGVSATAVQLTSALSAIANGGFLMKPHIVKRVVGKDGKSVLDVSPVIVKRVISDKTADTVKKILVGVTALGGTGEQAAIDGFEVAGKTGTAQKPDLIEGGYKKDAYVVSFLGLVPAESPRLVIYVAVDEPTEKISGGMTAAPAFKEIAEKSLPYLGVFPEGRSAPAVMTRLEGAEAADGIKVEPPRRARHQSKARADGDTVPDFSGKTMRAVLRIASEMGADVELSGSGLAKVQRPLAGEKLSAESPIVVSFQ